MEEPSHLRSPTGRATGGWATGGWHPSGWELWRLPGRAVALVFAVEIAAVAYFVAHAAIPDPGVSAGDTLALAAFLTLLSVVHTELATGIERIRRRAAETSYFDLSSVWTFAAALLLPPVLAAAVIAAVYLHLWQRVWRPANVPLHRHLYTTATVMLGTAILAAILLLAFAAAFGLCALAIGSWALWWGGMPQFSDLGWL